MTDAGTTGPQPERDDDWTVQAIAENHAGEAEQERRFSEWEAEERRRFSEKYTEPASGVDSADDNPAVTVNYDDSQGQDLTSAGLASRDADDQANQPVLEHRQVGVVRTPASSSFTPHNRQAPPVAGQRGPIAGS
jgi:hypothetical protein